MSNYVTLAELKAFRPAQSSAVLDFSSFADPELQAILDDAELLIENGCGDRFYSFDETVYASGRGMPFVFLPQDAAFPYRILDITSVQEVDFDKSTVLTTYVEGTDFQAEGHYLRANTTDADVARIRRAIGSSRTFAKGVKNIKIVGSFGWDETPPMVQRAVKMLAVISSLGEDSVGLSVGSADKGIVQESWSDYQVTYGSARAINRKLKNVPNITGYLDIDRLLVNYVNYSSLVLVPATV